METGLNKKNGVLYVLCGVPGVGKTTWAKANVPSGSVYISRDEVRFSILKPTDKYFSKEKEVYNEFIERIKEALSAGFDVYADATHLNRASRSKLLNAVGREVPSKVYALVFEAPLEICLKRNSGRTGRAYVPEEQIESMYHSFTRPVKSEGFTEVWIRDNSKEI